MQLKGNNVQHTKIRAEIEELGNVLRERTDASFDVGFNKTCRIVLTGRYRNNDYVEVVDVDASDFSELVGIVRRMNKYSKVRFIDAPINLRRVNIRNLLP